MKITGTITQKDYLQATLLHYKSNLSILLVYYGFLVIFGLTSLIGIIFTLLQRIPFSFIVPVLGVLLAILAVRYLLIPFIIANSFKSNKELNAPICYEFTESQISTSALSNQSSRPWSEIHELKEDKDTCLLYFGLNYFYIIPKRLFNSPQDLEKMRDWLSSSPVLKPMHLSDGRRNKIIVAVVIGIIIVVSLIVFIAYVFE